MKNPSWNPDQYLKFGDHRLRPGLELIARIPDIAPARVTDLGCGTGELTQILAGRWPTAAVTGLDSSPDMLAQCRTLSREIRWMETLSRLIEEEDVRRIICIGPSSTLANWIMNDDNIKGIEVVDAWDLCREPARQAGTRLPYPKTTSAASSGEANAV